MCLQLVTNRVRDSTKFLMLPVQGGKTSAAFKYLLSRTQEEHGTKIIFLTHNILLSANQTAQRINNEFVPELQTSVEELDSIGVLTMSSDSEYKTPGDIAEAMIRAEMTGKDFTGVLMLAHPTRFNADHLAMIAMAISDRETTKRIIICVDEADMYAKKVVSQLKLMDDDHRAYRLISEVLLVSATIVKGKMNPYIGYFGDIVQTMILDLTEGLDERYWYYSDTVDQNRFVETTSEGVSLSEFVHSVLTEVVGKHEKFYGFIPGFRQSADSHVLITRICLKYDVSVFIFNANDKCLCLKHDDETEIIEFTSDELKTLEVNQIVDYYVEKFGLSKFVVTGATCVARSCTVQSHSNPLTFGAYYDKIASDPATAFQFDRTKGAVKTWGLPPPFLYCSKRYLYNLLMLGEQISLIARGDRTFVEHLEAVKCACRNRLRASDYEKVYCKSFEHAQKKILKLSNGKFSISRVGKKLEDDGFWTWNEEVVTFDALDNDPCTYYSGRSNGSQFECPLIGRTVKIKHFPAYQSVHRTPENLGTHQWVLLLKMF